MGTQTRRELLYKKWCEGLLEAHTRVLGECFGSGTLEAADGEHGPLRRQLDAMAEALCTPEGFEASLSYAERLRLWRLDHLTLSPEGRDSVLDHVDRTLDAMDAQEPPEEILSEPP